MDSEDTNFVKSDPLKLKNSDILKDLDQKLSYHSSDKGLELKQLILEYEQLSPGIPSELTQCILMSNVLMVQKL